MLIFTQWTPLFKARAVNQTSASFVAKIPQAAEPADDVPGVTTATSQVSINMRNGGPVTQNGLIILPYAVASNDNTFSVRVIGWKKLGTDDITSIWIPFLLLEALCTADSTLIGLAGRLVVATEMFADTITLVGTSGNANVSHELVSPADGVSVAHIIVDTKGSDRVELSFNTNSSATSVNALVAMF